MIAVWSKLSSHTQTTIEKQPKPKKQTNPNPQCSVQLKHPTPTQKEPKEFAGYTSILSWFKLPGQLEAKNSYPK
jgi:hypothetical protein